MALNTVEIADARVMVCHLPTPPNSNLTAKAHQSAGVQFRARTRGLRRHLPSTPPARAPPSGRPWCTMVRSQQLPTRAPDVTLSVDAADACRMQPRETPATSTAGSWIIGGGRRERQRHAAATAAANACRGHAGTRKCSADRPPQRWHAHTGRAYGRS